MTKDEKDRLARWINKHPGTVMSLFASLLWTGMFGLIVATSSGSELVWGVGDHDDMPIWIVFAPVVIVLVSAVVWGLYRLSGHVNKVILKVRGL